MESNLNEGKLMQALNWAYDTAVNGIPGLDSAAELAASYVNQDEPIIEQVNSLIRWQNTKAGTSGFIAGLGGLLTMPITLPANVTSVIYLQVRMVAAIAHMGGHDLKDDRVKSLVYVCLTGNAAKDILKDIGITAGGAFAKSAIKNISGKTITEINKKVGFRLLTKFGEKGVINFGKIVPIFGGIIGATFDALATNTIGNIARNEFHGKVETPIPPTS